MAFLGSGGSKLLLFGEHAVVHGYKALGAGLPGRLKVRWTPGTGSLILSCPEPYQAAVTSAFRRIASFFGFNGCSGLLEIDSNIPVSAGMGSSGAICVALARALASSLLSGATGRDQPSAQDEQHIWAAAHEGEQVFHGSPSGVDTGLALWQRTCLFTPQPGALPSVSFLPAIGLTLVYGTVPREASCAAKVSAIGKAMSAGDVSTASALAELGRLATQAAILLSRGKNGIRPDSSSPERPVSSPRTVGRPSRRFHDSSCRETDTAEALGQLAGSAMDMLRQLGLSTPGMDTILTAGLMAGATGGKLSGGGAGGAFWLACPEERQASRIREAVIEEARRLGLPGDAYTGVLKL